VTVTNDDAISTSARRPVVLGPGEGRAHPTGDRVSAVFKADGAESDGRCSISEWWLEPHTKGPGPHDHPDDDLFFLLAGSMRFLLGDEWVTVEAGGFVLVPGGMTHAFDNPGDVRAGFLNISAPGGFEAHMPGIADWFRTRSEAEATC
jgi:mannose-6-phosphate isomerase-like protein (cupin superfamily)